MPQLWKTTTPDEAVAGQVLPAFTFICAGCVCRATVCAPGLTLPVAERLQRRRGWRCKRGVWRCEYCCIPRFVVVEGVRP
jgi:hypothetical protein